MLGEHHVLANARPAIRIAVSVDGVTNTIPGNESRSLPIQAEPHEKGLTNKVLLRNKAPTTAIITVVAIVANHEVMPFRYLNLLITHKCT